MKKYVSSLFTVGLLIVGLLVLVLITPRPLMARGGSTTFFMLPYSDVSNTGLVDQSSGSTDLFQEIGDQDGDTYIQHPGAPATGLLLFECSLRVSTVNYIASPPPVINAYPAWGAFTAVVIHSETIINDPDSVVIFLKVGDQVVTEWYPATGTDTYKLNEDELILYNDWIAYYGEEAASLQIGIVDPATTVSEQTAKVLNVYMDEQ